jgi:hypothetical protein
MRPPIYTQTDMARDVARSAASRNVDQLLKAWDLEIQAAFEKLRKKGAELDQQKRAENAEQRRLLAQEAADRALGEAVGNYLEGLANQARSNDSSAVTVPSGYRAASLVLSGPPIADIHALIGNILEDIVDGRSDSPSRAQQSAAWALGQGLSPHPGDLAAILDGAGADQAWSSHFREIGAALERVDAARFKHAQLQGFTGHERINLLQEHVSALKAYGSDRLVDLVTRPASLTGGTRAPADPPATQAQRGGMSGNEFNRMLDDLFGRKR